MTEATRRGFASMDRDKQRQIASKGGKTAHSKGKAHEFTSQQAREAGRKGGLTVSQNRQHMASIGKKGGEAVSRDRAYMAEIGRRGGAAANEERPTSTVPAARPSETGRTTGEAGQGASADPNSPPASSRWEQAG